jgi:hypothetical protein
MSDVQAVNGQLLASDEMDFSSLIPKEVQVKLPDIVNGLYQNRTKQCVLRSASAGAVKRWRMASLQGASMEMNDTNDTRTLRNLGGVSGADSLLLSLCMFEVNGNERRSVSQATIEDQTIEVQTKLMERLESISPHLNAAETLPVLRKQLEKLQEKIRRLEESDPKKLLDSGTLSCATVMS